MVNVLFITYYFPPIGGAGVQRTVKFARYLPGEGYGPVVVTGAGKTEGRWTPDDATFLEEIPRDVPVYRINDPVPRDGGISGHILRWLHRPGAFSHWWINSAIGMGEKAIKENDIRFIYASMSPYESAGVAEYLSKKFGIPWIADLRDPWALDEMQVYCSALHRRLELNQMHRLLSTASSIIMNTPEAVVALKREFPDFSEKRVVCITNGFDKNDFAEAPPPRDDTQFRIVHSGYLHTEAGLSINRKQLIYRALGGMKDDINILTRSHVILVEAIKKALERIPGLSRDLQMFFVGVSTETDRSFAHNSGISGLIHFTGFLSHAESIRIMRTADLLFLPMHNVPAGKRATIVPGKTYEYMASGRPILAAVPDGDARDFLMKCGTAFPCRPDDSAAMADAVAEVYDAWKKGKDIVSPHTGFISEFDRRVLTRQLADVFDGLLKGEC